MNSGSRRSPGSNRGRPATPAIERFMAKVVEGPVPEYRPELGPCLLWTGARTTYSNGQYGRLRDDNSRMVPAHRWHWEYVNGPTDAAAMDHLCRVTMCVRPHHLEPVSDRENILRGATLASANALKTHCPNGHPFDLFRAGRRGCRQCRAAQLRRNYLDRKARAITEAGQRTG